jgi:predicted acyltransferase
MAKREISLDVLRGLAIIGMVLSGTISRNPDLPAWLFHAQIAPPDFKFDPNLPGITWVDLVFPFFLFAMGMAFPFAMNKMVEQGGKMIVRKIIIRSFKLFFFAVMLGHLSPFHYPQEMGWLRYFLGLLGFVGFFLAFAKFPHLSRHEGKINMAGYLLLVTLCAIRVQVFELPFSIHRNDIIILVLANMALFGALIWLFTRQNWYLRLGIMALYFSLRLTHNMDDSWNRMLWDFTPFKWIAANLPAIYDSLLSIGLDLKKTIFYHPEYLKYLMILIPGTIAGELLYAGIREKASISQNPGDRMFIIIPAILLLNISLNLWGLLSRNLDFVWLMNLASIALLLWFLKKEKQKRLKNLRQLLYWSIFWLALGLVFEAWKGGIKKDHSTISYFFLTSGLAGFSIVFFKMLEPIFQPGKMLGFIGQIGMNPMLGYVAAAYFIMPVLYFVQILPWMDQWHEHWSWAGFIRGIILTGLMALMTVLSVKWKHYWKT